MNSGERGSVGPARAAAATGVLPDGSLYYGSRPPPGMPGGGPPRPEVGWGPEFGGGEGYEFKHCGPPRRRQNGLVAGLLVPSAVAMLLVIAAMAVREGDATTVSPAPDASQATPSRVDDITPSPEPTGPPGPARPTKDSAQIVVADAFYSTGPHASVGCREPQVALTTRAALQAYYTNLVGCLNQAWGPKVRAAQDTFMPPRVVFWGGYVQSPCAGGWSVSFYCRTNRTLYLSYDDPIRVWNRSADSANRAFARMWATDTAGREFGQHVQQLTGILAAAHRLEYDAPDHEARLELARRIELQAACLGGVFIGANHVSYGLTGLDLAIYRRDVAGLTGEEDQGGGPRHHGSRASRRYWAVRGFDTVDGVYCNTFTAPAGLVS